MEPKHLTVAITGATGAIHGVRLLEMLRETGGVHTHLVVTAAGWMNLEQELDRPRKEIEALADEVHGPREVGASIASGSFPVSAMVVATCSMRTLAAIALGLSDNLVTRAADVMLKERRRLVLMPREAPLNLAHLRNMVSVTEMGAIVYPPVPAFYHRPETLAQMVDHTCGRVLELLGVDQRYTPRWTGIKSQ